MTTTTAASTYLTTTTAASTYLTTTAASTYASKTATTDQSFVGNIVIGTGKTLTTPAITLNGTSLASTLTGKADIAGATFTGNVIGLTQSTSDSSTKFATTAYVQNNLANYQQPFHIAARIRSDSVILGSYGLNSITNISKSTGQYTLTFPAHPSAANYGVVITSRGSYASGTPQFVRYSNPTSTTVIIQLFNYSTIALEDPVDFTVHTIP